MTAWDVAPPTSKLLYPETSAVKPLSVATSRKYFVAPDDACQLAVKPEVVMALGAEMTGAAGGATGASSPTTPETSSP